MIVIVGDMPHVLVPLCLILATYVSCENELPQWYYDANADNEQWTGACKGRKQSPVDIVDANVDIKRTSTTIELINYRSEIEFTMENNGHTVALKVNPERKPYIKNHKGEKYELHQLHYHWGSEHTFNGRRYPLEVHLVHKPRKSRHRRHDVGNIGSLHVLSALFFINKNPNPMLNNMIRSFTRTMHVGNTTKLKLIPRNMLPFDITRYYQYEGSLTTPGCDEIVQWTVFETKIPMSLQQYAVFNHTETFNGSFSHNYRNVQPLNNRTINYYYVESSGSVIFHKSCPLILGMALVYVIRDF